jgi:hypothetical protein
MAQPVANRTDVTVEKAVLMGAFVSGSRTRTSSRIWWRGCSSVSVCETAHPKTVP